MDAAILNLSRQSTSMKCWVRWTAPNESRARGWPAACQLHVALASRCPAVPYEHAPIN